MQVSLDIFDSKRIAYPTIDLVVPKSFFRSPSSSLTRRASEIAEIRRGFVVRLARGTFKAKGMSVITSVQ
jgi:hypothetical protein